MLSHLKPLIEYTGVSDNINRYHNILYFWLIIYGQIKFQGCSSISLLKNDKQILIENIHHNISNKKDEVKNTTHVNSISNLSIFKSKIVQPKTDDHLVDLMNCDEESITLIDQSKHIKIV